MGRFYDEAFAALIDFNAIVDKFVGDEVGRGSSSGPTPARSMRATPSMPPGGCSR